MLVHVAVPGRLLYVIENNWRPPKTNIFLHFAICSGFVCRDSSVLLIAKDSKRGTGRDVQRAGQGSNNTGTSYPRVRFSDIPLSTTISTAPVTPPLIANTARGRGKQGSLEAQGSTYQEAAKDELERSCFGGGVCQIVTTAPPQNREGEKAERNMDERRVASGMVTTTMP